MRRVGEYSNTKAEESIAETALSLAGRWFHSLPEPALKHGQFEVGACRMAFGRPRAIQFVIK